MVAAAGLQRLTDAADKYVTQGTGLADCHPGQARIAVEIVILPDVAHLSVLDEGWSETEGVDDCMAFREESVDFGLLVLRSQQVKVRIFVNNQDVFHRVWLIAVHLSLPVNEHIPGSLDVELSVHRKHGIPGFGHPGGQRCLVGIGRTGTDGTELGGTLQRRPDHNKIHIVVARSFPPDGNAFIFIAVLRYAIRIGRISTDPDIQRERPRICIFRQNGNDGQRDHGGR